MQNDSLRAIASSRVAASMTLMINFDHSQHHAAELSVLGLRFRSAPWAMIQRVQTSALGSEPAEPKPKKHFHLSTRRGYGGLGSRRQAVLQYIVGNDTSAVATPCRPTPMTSHRRHYYVLSDRNMAPLADQITVVLARAANHDPADSCRTQPGARCPAAPGRRRLALLGN